MESQLYVNSPARERKDTRQREKCCSGGSNILWLVIVSFGVLCIVQATLNVALRLNSVGGTNKYNTTNNSNMMSADQLIELISERDRLSQENSYKDLVIRGLVRDKNLLHDRNIELQRRKPKPPRRPPTVVSTIKCNNPTSNPNVMSADQIRDLTSERDQLILDNDRLSEDNNNKEATIKRLVKEKDALQDGYIALQELLGKPPTAKPKPSNCPSGWQQHPFSCYKVSTRMGTWEEAELDCERQGAHLVTLSDAYEERVVPRFGSKWIGLIGQTKNSVWMWTWVDGSPLVYTNWIQYYTSPTPLGSYRGCVCTERNLWRPTNCYEQKRWICEIDLDFVLPEK
ncbi:asialoglycoprotein receptor 1-like [Notolabrus celidotus]|uniref:asialoglycoprotein receptor 1-like n=1 Tax=Notolabrus celidotus TaxID=1203425 RepID=UPI00148F45FE|nr:asialoglycoprotein receptor 1-like [Notolabrus celidotus]